MSRIGRMPIAIPADVTVEIAENNKVTVKGPKGTLERVLPAEMQIKKDGNEIVVSRPNDLKKMKSLHGLTRTLIYNMIVGVTKGYEKVLEINGVGYRGAKQGKKLVLNLGYSHPVEMIDPEGIETVMEGQNKIIVKGIDKEKVGQFAAEIREKRAPEPYKGKDVKLVRLVRNNKESEKEWLVRYQEREFAKKSIEDCVDILMVLLNDHVCLYLEAIIICMHRSLMIQLVKHWCQLLLFKRTLRLN